MADWLRQRRKKNLKMCPELVDHYTEGFFNTANAQVMPSISRLIVLVKVLYFFARALEPHLLAVRYE